MQYLKTTDLTPVQLVEQIRNEIFESTQLTASAGTDSLFSHIYKKSYAVVDLIYTMYRHRLQQDIGQSM